MQDRTHVQKNFRNEENPRDIVIAPRNVVTGPTKVGRVGKQVYFDGKIPYIEDDYNRPKQLASKELEYHKSKVQEQPFRQRVPGIPLFNSHKAVLGEDKPMPPKAEPEAKPPAMEHDRPFKPSHPPREGYNKTLAPFPTYMEEPPKELKRKMKVEGSDEPPKFKPTHNYKTRPTPSVATNLRNLKASFPSVFRR